jgi:sulfur carrier protein ThiS
MKVTLKLYATLCEYLPAEARRTSAWVVDVAPGTTVTQMITGHGVPEQKAHLVLVNGLYVPPEERAARVLGDNDELAVWPPVAGG